MAEQEADEPTVVDEPEADRFAARLGGEVAGVAEYRREGDTLTMTHTRVEDRFEDRGVGSALARQALQTVREQGGQVLPECSFIRSYIERHADDYLDLVPADQRERFELPAA